MKRGTRVGAPFARTYSVNPSPGPKYLGPGITNSSVGTAKVQNSFPGLAFNGREVAEMDPSFQRCLDEAQRART